MILIPWLILVLRSWYGTFFNRCWIYQTQQCRTAVSSLKLSPTTCNGNGHITIPALVDCLKRRSVVCICAHCKPLFEIPKCQIKHICNRAKTGTTEWLSCFVQLTSGTVYANWFSLTSLRFVGLGMIPHPCTQSLILTWQEEIHWSDSFFTNNYHGKLCLLIMIALSLHADQTTTAGEVQLIEVHVPFLPILLAQSIDW